MHRTKLFSANLSLKNTLTLLLTSAVFSVFVFCSCTPKDATYYELKYSRDSVNRWLADSNFEKLIFQFYSPDIQKHNKEMQLVAYAVNLTDSNCRYVYLRTKEMPPGSGTYIPAPDTLTIVSDSSIVFTDAAIWGNLEIGRDQLYRATRHADDTEKDYDFIFCKPQKHPLSNHIYYRIYATKAGVKVPKKPGDADADDELNPRPPAQ